MVVAKFISEPALIHAPTLRRHRYSARLDGRHGNSLRFLTSSLASLARHGPVMFKKCEGTLHETDAH